MRQLQTIHKRVLGALLISSATSVVLLIARSHAENDRTYWFLNWNLLLAWLPLIFALRLAIYLRGHRWFSFKGILLTLLWLGFLPNSFYLASDLIHLQTLSDEMLLYDVVMLLSYTWNGFALGFMSLYVVHRELAKILQAAYAHGLVAGVVLLCSYAIYLGRYLRWNTWDVLVNPAGLIFDVSDQILNPTGYPETFLTTSTFFVLLGSIYLVIWYVAEALQANTRR